MSQALSPQFVALVEAATEAVAHLDAPPAARYLQQLEIAWGSLTDEQKRDIGFVGELRRLQVQLQLVGFPELSQEAAADVIRTRLLEFFLFEIPLTDRLETRYIFQGYHVKNEERKILKQAILGNAQMLGDLTVGQWLAAFDSAYKPETRDENDIPRFIAGNPQVNTLKPVDLYMLREILSVYETLLATRIVDMYDIAAAEQAALNPNARPATPTGMYTQESEKPQVIAASIKDIPTKSISENSQSQVMGEVLTLPLLDALGKYPRLSEQIIGNDRIWIKSEREPARATLRNWIRAYRDELGVGRHTSVDRGKFLFQTTNTKNLGSTEREQLSWVIRSLEDNEALPIDTARQVIVFPPPTQTPAPTQEIPQVITPLPQPLQTPTPIPVPLAPPTPQATPSHPVAGIAETPPALAQFSPSFGRINPSGASGLHMPTESPQRLNPQTPIQTIQPESLEFSSGQMLPGEQDAWQAQQNEK